MPTYFVDLGARTNGAGTEVSPYNALSALPALSAGDVVRIRGTQTMSGVYSVAASGTAGNPITFEAWDSASPPQLFVASASANCFTITSRSNIVLRHLWLRGTFMATYTTGSYARGVLVNGSSSNITFDGVRADGMGIGIELAGGFATSNVSLTNCELYDNGYDGLRWWSGTGTYTWSSVSIAGGRYTGNGIKQGANGHGINILVQTGHTGTVFAGIAITGATVSGNFREGISANDGSVPWSTLIAAGNTTPPTRQIQGIEIVGNTVENNGGAGISVLGARGRVFVDSNTLRRNSARSTLGSIWTGGCLAPVISNNLCEEALSNGTVIGDGCGIFDDQWNDGAIVRNNVIRNNVFQSFNPEFTAFGIGIYRCANGFHYGNVIEGCRYGFVIGSVAGATAPTMAGIRVVNNTIKNAAVQGVIFQNHLPASAITLSNTLIVGSNQPMSAQSTTAGTQTFQTNQSWSAVNQTDGANITDGCSFQSGEPPVNGDSSLRVSPDVTLSTLAADNPLALAGTYVQGVALRNGRMRPGYCPVGAYQAVLPRQARSA
jgi:hypothetical protein